MTPKQFEKFINDLIKNYGYNVVLSKKRIKGRGALHQIDSVGINKFVPAFSYPITLLAEAKYKTEESYTIGIEIIRNFYGVLEDIRQNIPNKYKVPLIEKNNYVNGTSNIIGVVISNVGFSFYAKQFAYAHGVYLVTVIFIENTKAFFGNLNGQTVIVQINTKNKEKDIDDVIKDFLSTKLKHGKLSGRIISVSKIKFRDSDIKSKKELLNITCYQYKIELKEDELVSIEINVISQTKIKKESILAIELPDILTYLTIEIKS